MQTLIPKKVIAAVIRDNDKVLIAQRAKKDANFGKWEFPGGKMEEGETEHECLQRELNEEFGIEAQVGEYIISSFFEHNGSQYEMRAYEVPSFKGTISLFDHQAITWVMPNELVNFEMPSPDEPIVKHLKNNKKINSLYVLIIDRAYYFSILFSFKSLFKAKGKIFSDL